MTLPAALLLLLLLLLSVLLRIDDGAGEMEEASMLPRPLLCRWPMVLL